MDDFRERVIEKLSKMAYGESGSYRSAATWLADELCLKLSDPFPEPPVGTVYQNTISPALFFIHADREWRVHFSTGITEPREWSRIKLELARTSCWKRLN